MSWRAYVRGRAVGELEWPAAGDAQVADRVLREAVRRRPRGGHYRLRYQVLQGQDPAHRADGELRTRARPRVPHHQLLHTAATAAATVPARSSTRKPTEIPTRDHRWPDTASRQPEGRPRGKPPTRPSGQRAARTAPGTHPRRRGHAASAALTCITAWVKVDRCTSIGGCRRGGGRGPVSCLPLIGAMDRQADGPGQEPRAARLPPATPEALLTRPDACE